MIGEELMLTIRAIAERKGLPCIIGHKDLEEQFNANNMAALPKVAAVPAHRVASLGDRQRLANPRKHRMGSRRDRVGRR